MVNKLQRTNLKSSTQRPAAEKNKISPPPQNLLWCRLWSSVFYKSFRSIKNGFFYSRASPCRKASRSGMHSRTSWQSIATLRKIWTQNKSFISSQIRPRLKTKHTCNESLLHGSSLHYRFFFRIRKIHYIPTEDRPTITIIYTNPTHPPVHDFIKCQRNVLIAM